MLVEVVVGLHMDQMHLAAPVVAAVEITVTAQQILDLVVALVDKVDLELL